MCDPMCIQALSRQSSACGFTENARKPSHVGNIRLDCVCITRSYIKRVTITHAFLVKLQHILVYPRKHAHGWLE